MKERKKVRREGVRAKDLKRNRNRGEIRKRQEKPEVRG